MKQIGESFKTYLTTGLLILFPLFACVYVIVAVMGWLSGLIKPLVVELLPQSGLVNVAITDVASLFIVVGLCVVVGIIAKTERGLRFATHATRPLNGIPGYRMFVRIARIVFDEDDASGTPVVVDRGESRQLGFMMEEIEGGEMVVFFPEAPGVISGSVEIVKSSTVHKLSIPPVRLFRTIASYGAGTSILLADQVNMHKPEGK